MVDELRKAWDRAWRRTEQQQYIYGLLGRHNADGTVSFVPTGRALYKYVTVRNAGGAQTVVVARDDAGVPHQADLPVRMKNERGTYVIEGVTRREDLAVSDPPPASGLPIHTHDDRYFRENEHVSVSAGAADAGKPAVLDENGQWDESMLPAGAQGGFGGNSVKYAYSTTTTDADPGNGQLRFNNSTFGSITQLFVDDLNDAGANVEAWLATLDDSSNAQKGYLRVFKEADSTVYRIFSITGALTEATGYWKVPVQPIVSNGVLANADKVVVSFARSGDVGAQGPQGDQGIQGPAGDAADIAAEISGAATDDTIQDVDLFGYVTGGTLVKTAWSNIKSVLRTGFDAVYGRLSAANTWTNGQTITHSSIGQTIERTTSNTNQLNSVAIYKATSSGQMADGFGTGFIYQGKDADGVDQTFGITGAVRDDADNTSRLEGYAYLAGVAQLVYVFKANGNVGFGTSSPQGKFHVHDGTGGMLFVTKTGIVGSAQTIIPNGTGDVLYQLRYNAVTRDSAGNVNTADGGIAPGAEAQLINNGGGTDVMALRVNADGSVDVRRTAGSRTYMCNLFLQWL